MKSVEMLAYGSLCDFVDDRPEISNGERVARGTYRFESRTLAKDAIEGWGIPHPEVDLLLSDGKPIPFDRELRDGSRLEAFPIGHPASRDKPSLVRPSPLPRWRFLVDENLGKLATFLLILGLDTAIDPAWDDAALAEISAREQRFLLTRDIGLLKRAIVTHGHWVRSDDPRTQITEVIRRFGLWPLVKPFTRCLECNFELAVLEKAKAEGRVPPAAFSIYDEFFLCPECQKVFWKGSHFDRMRSWLDDLHREFDR